MSMNIRFDNKVAVVTGGTAGIGLACAQLFGQLGAKVAICGTDPTKLAAALEELKAEGIISGGMIPKVECCTNAIRAGVRKVFIIDGRVPHALLIETLTDEGAGTMFKKEIEGNYVPKS